MAFQAKLKLAMIVCGLSCCFSFAQEVRTPKSPSSPQILRNATPDSPQMRMTADDALAIIAAALDSRVRSGARRDCSHLVHAIYVRAGFPYTYVRSSDLYAGTDKFQRVSDPEPGDLVVWKGHVGIVIYPAQRIFFSAMRSGLGTDSYEAPYWKRRGQARFYRYIKDGSLTNSQPTFELTNHE
jgi:cell wall-associated NlpC family hydrolase